MRYAAKRDGNEQELMDEAATLGWVAVQVSDEGFPDLVLLRRGRVVFVEVKSHGERNRISDAQRDTFATLRANGVEVHVCVTREDMRRALGAPAPKYTPEQQAAFTSAVVPRKRKR